MGSGSVAKQRAHDELVRAVEELGYPEEFGEVLAGELGGERSMRRMSAYLRQAGPLSPEQIADELLAILARRERWVEQRMSEHAGTTMTAFYNRPREDDLNDLGR